VQERLHRVRRVACAGFGETPSALAVSCLYGHLTADVTPLFANSLDGSLRLGFAAPDDGIRGLPSTTPSYAQDNDECLSDLTNARLDVQYARPAPTATPASCAVDVACGDAVTVRCADTTSAVRLDRLDPTGWRTVGSVAPPYFGGPALSDTGPSNADTARYRVCATSLGGSEDACAELLVSLPHTACSYGGGGGGGDDPPPRPCLNRVCGGHLLE